VWNNELTAKSRDPAIESSVVSGPRVNFLDKENWQLLPT
jgi:hypothetical protein